MRLANLPRLKYPNWWQQQSNLSPSRRAALRKAATSSGQSRNTFSWVMDCGTFKLKAKPGGVRSRYPSTIFWDGLR